MSENETVPTIDPKRAALLVMDYQRGILGFLPDAARLLSRMAATIAVARTRGVTIGYVRVAFSDADYAAIKETNKSFAAVAASRRFPYDAPESQIDDAVAPAPGDILVRKVRVGAFSTTDLSRQLSDRNIDTLILAGISTSGVVLSTVREAADRDYRLYVLEDASADPDREVHDTLMTKVFHRQAYVIKTDDLPGLLGAQ